MRSEFVRETFATTVGPFLRRQHERGVEVILVVPPDHPALDRMVQGRHAEELQGFLSQRQSYGRMFTAPPEFLQRTGWTDRDHLCTEAAMQVQDLILLTRTPRE